MASAVTEVRVYLNKQYQKGDTYLGMANVTLNEDFAVKGIRILNGKRGAFIAMPAAKKGEGWEDICFPVTKACRAEISNAVLAEAKKAKANGGVSPKAGAEKKDIAGVNDIPF